MSTNAPWAGKIFSSGWTNARGGTADVIEPATGQALASVGLADAEDVDRAARSAQAARGAWARTPFDQRAAVLREAARLLKERAAEINGWNIRECGSIGPKAEWELHATYEQMLMAAALPMQASGQIFPSSMPGRTNLAKSWRSAVSSYSAGGSSRRR